MAEACAPHADAAAGPGFRLRAEPDLGVLRVRIFGGEEPAGLAELLGGAFPTPGRSTTLAEGLAWAWVAPGEWLILGGDAALRDRLEVTLQAKVALVTDHSHATASFLLTGPAARDRLASACPLDLRDERFPPGAVARSLLNETGVFIARLADGAADPSFRLIVDQTAADYAARLIGLPSLKGAS